MELREKFLQNFGFVDAYLTEDNMVAFRDTMSDVFLMRLEPEDLQYAGHLATVEIKAQEYAPEEEK